MDDPKVVIEDLFKFQPPFPAKNIVSQFFWVYRKVTQGSTKKIVQPVTLVAI